MSVESALARGRALADALMVTTVRIRRQTGKAKNPVTGQIEPTWAVIYEGPARVRFGNTQPRDIDAAGQLLVEQSPTVSLPIGADSALVRTNDEGTVLGNPPDPGLVGLDFRIAGIHAQTHATARRFPVEVTTHG